MGERVLITGASSGIGLAAAVACAAGGHEVVATMRRLEKRGALVEAARERGVTLAIEPLDVTRPDAGDTVRALVAKHGAFHTVVNNAGIGIFGAFEEQSDDDVRAQVETNVFGVLAVTRAVLPSMRAAGRGRIINVTSLAGHVAPPFLSVYAATKHAIEGFSEGLRWEVEPFGIQVVAAAPGTIKTPMFTSNYQRGSLRRPHSPFAAATHVVERRMLREAAKGLSPEVAGAAIARLVTDPAPPFRVAIGTDALVLSSLHRVLPERALASVLRRAFFSKR